MKSATVFSKCARKTGYAGTTTRYRLLDDALLRESPTRQRKPRFLCECWTLLSRVARAPPPPDDLETAFRYRSSIPTPHVDWRIEDASLAWPQQDLHDLLDAGDRNAMKRLLLNALPTWRASQRPMEIAPRYGGCSRRDAFARSSAKRSEPRKACEPRFAPTGRKFAPAAQPPSSMARRYSVGRPATVATATGTATSAGRRRDLPPQRLRQAGAWLQQSQRQGTAQRAHRAGNCFFSTTQALTSTATAMIRYWISSPVSISHLQRPGHLVGDQRRHVSCGEQVERGKGHLLPRVGLALDGGQRRDAHRCVDVPDQQRQGRGQRPAIADQRGQCLAGRIVIRRRQRIHRRQRRHRHLTRGISAMQICQLKPSGARTPPSHGRSGRRSYSRWPASWRPPAPLEERQQPTAGWSAPG